MNERDMEEEGKNREREEWEIVRKFIFLESLYRVSQKWRPIS
jgi:hypothetical protein